jgi:DNA-directed RNA polymerase subunit alpha
MFKIEPLERGFGVTLANSLRRILISSLQGAAVTAIKIEGADHEFSALPGVKEDITDIVLNVKQIVFKYGGSDRRRLSLKATGPCVVTAGMIETSHDVEVVNKDQVICTLGKDSKLNIEFIVETGKGYVSANDNRNPDTPLGVIPIDAMINFISQLKLMDRYHLTWL